MVLVLKERRIEADNIWSFIFIPEKPLTWSAGQSLRIEVPGLYGALEHRFSIASPPHSGIIMITTRHSDSDFKQSLFKLQPGSTARAFGLEGNFVWQKTTRRPVYIAAGIGITPFHAMIAEQTHAGLSPDLTLIYGSRDNNIAFKSIIDKWQHDHPQLAIHYIIGEYITAPHVIGLVPDIAGRPIFVSGPSAMVDDVSAGLLASGVSESQLQRDWFTGRLRRDG